MSISAEEKNRYLRETAIVLAREGFHTDRTHTGGLRVLLDGAPLCEVTENGGITYRNEDMPQAGIRTAQADGMRAWIPATCTVSWHQRLGWRTPAADIRRSQTEMWNIPSPA